MKRPTTPTAEGTGRLNFQVTPDIERRFKLKGYSRRYVAVALFEVISVITRGFRSIGESKTIAQGRDFTVGIGTRAKQRLFTFAAFEPVDP